MTRSLLWPAFALSALLVAQSIPFPGPGMPSGGGGGMSSINTTAVQNTKSVHNATTVAFGSNLTVGNLAVVAITDDGGALVISSVTGTNNTYTAFPTCTIANGPRNVFVYYAKNIIAGAETVTVGVTSGTTGFINISEWTGASATAPADTCAVSNSGTTIGPLTTALDNELLMAVTIDTGLATTCSGYTILDQGVFNTYNTVATLAAGAAGAYTASGCPNNLNARALAAFK